MTDTAAKSLSERVPILLVVDDDLDTLTSLRQILETELAPVTVLATNSAEDALRILEGNEIQALLADYRMPGVNGLDLILRAHRVREDLPAFLITSYPNEQVAHVAHTKAHVAAYITKPIDAQELRERINAILRPDHAR